MALALLALLAAFPSSGLGEVPPAVPDLSIAPESIRFTHQGSEMPLISQELVYITIEVAVRNAGPGNSSGANVSFFDNGRFLALVPAGGDLSISAPGNETSVLFDWYIADTEPGNHTIRVEVSDPAGDADPTDNSAVKNLTLRPRAPVIAVKLHTASQNAPVTAASPARPTFSGSVVVDHWPGEAEVKLSAAVDIGWACALNWTSLIVTDTSPHDFSVDVTVPPGTRNSQFGQLTISARAAMDGMSATAQTKGIVVVEPYFCVTAMADRNTVVVEPDEPAVFRLGLVNTGNAVDSYSVEVLGQEALERKGWTARLSNQNIPKVFPDGRKTFTIELVPHEDWTPYKDEDIRFDVKVSSLNADKYNVDVHAVISLTVEQRGFYMPAVGLICLAALMAVIVAAVALRARRRRARRKTAADWDRELGLE
jgi:hypothetical protein